MIEMPSLAMDGAIILGIVILIVRQNKVVEERTDKKVKRVYSRLDEHKDDIERKYVLKEMCTVIHEQTQRDIKEIKENVAYLVRVQKNGKS